MHCICAVQKHSHTFLAPLLPSPCPLMFLHHTYLRRLLIRKGDAMLREWLGHVRTLVSIESSGISPHRQERMTYLTVKRCEFLNSDFGLHSKLLALKPLGCVENAPFWTRGRPRASSWTGSSGEAAGAQEEMHQKGSAL